MNLQEKLNHQFHELYVNPDEVAEHSLQEKPADNLVMLKANDSSTAIDIVPGIAISLVEARNRVELMQKFIKEMMVPGVDFGQIPGCPKPTLLKSGAEKLCDIFGFSRQVEILNRITDWEKGIFEYEVKVILTNKRTGLIEAEGLGSCNTMEKKYIGQDAYSVAGTILKMAKKRALVDAVLTATRSSDIFTQDVEDMPANTHKVVTASKPVVQPPATSAKLVSDKQLTMIASLINKIRMPEDTVQQLLLDKYQVIDKRDLNTKQASGLIKYLLELKG